MEIQVFNKNKIQNDEDSNFIQLMIQSFLGQWGITQDINIKIELNSKESGQIGGMCRLSDSSYIIVVDKKDLLNMCDNDTMQYMMELARILAHECTHIKQYIKEELKISIKNDKMIKKWKTKYISNLDYSNLPHEKEAYKYQEKMISNFFKEVTFMGEF